MSNIETRVKTVLAENLGLKAEDIKNDAHLIDDMGADSLDVVEVVMAIEDEFGITVPDDSAQGLTTVQSIIAFVTAHVSGEAVSA